MMARGKFLILACLLGILASAVQAAPPSASPTPKIVPPYGLYEKFDSSVVTAASILPSLPPRPALGLSSDEELDTLFFLSFQKDFKRRYTSQVGPITWLSFMLMVSLFTAAPYCHFTFPPLI